MFINKNFNNLNLITWKDTFKLYFKEKSLGSFSQARAEILLEYDAEDFNVLGKDRKFISG